MDTVSEELVPSKIDTVIIPGGCTKYIPAPDVVWNKPFKAKVTEQYDEWMAGQVHSFTAAGNMRGAPRKKIVKWILEAWDSLDNAMIVASFKSCGLHMTVALDGLEEDDIHCFKENQSCHSGLTRMKVVQHAITQSRESDPFDGITESVTRMLRPTILILTKVTVTINLSLIENN